MNTWGSSIIFLIVFIILTGMGWQCRNCGNTESFVEINKVQTEVRQQKGSTRIEKIVNKKIRENIPISSSHKKYEQAVEEGAIALFEEKYSDTVRVITMGNISQELCGGTHLEFSGEMRIKAIEQLGNIGTRDALLALLELAANEKLIAEERDLALRQAREIVKSGH